MSRKKVSLKAGCISYNIYEKIKKYFLVSKTSLGNLTCKSIGLPRHRGKQALLTAAKPIAMKLA